MSRRGGRAKPIAEDLLRATPGISAAGIESVAGRASLRYMLHMAVEDGVDAVQTLERFLRVPGMVRQPSVLVLSKHLPVRSRVRCERC